MACLAYNLRKRARSFVETDDGTDINEHHPPCPEVNADGNHHDTNVDVEDLHFLLDDARKEAKKCPLRLQPETVLHILEDNSSSLRSAKSLRRRFPALWKEHEKEQTAQRRRPTWSRVERLHCPSPSRPPTQESSNSSSCCLQGQWDHVQRGIGILRRSPLLIDTSMMGDGKTYTTCFLARELNFSSVVVVCPVPVQSKWKRMESLHGVPIEYVTSYQSLRSGSTARDDMSPRMVRKTNVENAQGKIVSYFEPNTLFQSLVQQGTLLVLDEFHNAKNLSIQHKACRALVRHVMDEAASSGAPSRVIFLSGTPIDETKHSVNMLRLMGVLRHPQLVDVGQTPRGLAEIIDFCLFIDRDATESVLMNNNNNNNNNGNSDAAYSDAEQIAYALFQRVLLRGAGISMPPQPRDEDIICCNTYYTMDDRDSKALVENVENLGHVLRTAGVVAGFNSSTPTSTSSHTEHQGGGATLSAQFIYGEISRTLMYIEYAKVNVFCRAALARLSSDPTCKVVIFLNYLMNLRMVANRLESEGYSVLTMSGIMQQTERGTVLDKFQDYSLDHRILVTQLKVGSTGIDLDDKYGDRPRYAFASPNYNVIDLYQLTRRFHRVDTKSTAYVRFVYGNVAHHETRLLTALARKSEVMKDTLSKQVDAGIQFPSDFPYEYD